MNASRSVLFAFVAAGAMAQTCPPTGTYSPCELVFELNAQEAAAHPNPYRSVEIQAEFRSPRHRTFLMPGYWDGGARMVIRFSPTEAGEWDFRVTSNVPRFHGKLGKFTATDSGAAGFVRAANGRHWATSEDMKPHLWMGDTSYRFATIGRELFETIAAGRAAQKFNHLRGLVLGWDSKAYLAPDQPDPTYFQELDRRIAYLNGKGIVADLVLAGDEGHLLKLFPERGQRERYLRYLAARYAPMNVTWQGVQEYEEYGAGGRELLKETGLLLKRWDPYDHPRSTHTTSTSSPLLPDGWMTHIVYQTSDDQIGAVEHQLYTVPQVNAEFAYEDSGAGRSHAHHVDSNEFRRRLWNASMNGMYPTFGNTGTYGGRKFEVEAKYVESPGARAMTAWYDFFSRTRHWELEPYFDVDGGRALALEGVEYVVYVEKPSGPVELLVERHGYQVYWFNPASGEFLKRKDWKGTRFTAEPPNRTQDWVLHLSRDGRKEGMLRSYKFESRPLPVQEVEQNPQKVPFEVAEPAGDISLGNPPKYAVRITRESRATRAMMYLWTGDVAAGGLGFRLLGTGPAGTLRLFQDLARQLPAVLTVRISAMNAFGKVYAVDKVYTLKP